MSGHSYELIVELHDETNYMGLFVNLFDKNIT